MRFTDSLKVAQNARNWPFFLYLVRILNSLSISPRVMLPRSLIFMSPRAFTALPRSSMAMAGSLRTATRPFHFVFSSSAQDTCPGRLLRTLPS